MPTSGLPLVLTVVQGPEHVLEITMKTSSWSSQGAKKESHAYPMLYCEPLGQCGPDRPRHQLAPPFEAPPGSGGLFKSVAAVFWNQVHEGGHCPFAKRRLMSLEEATLKVPQQRRRSGEEIRPVRSKPRRCASPSGSSCGEGESSCRGGNLLFDQPVSPPRYPQSLRLSSSRSHSSRTAARAARVVVGVAGVWRDVRLAPH